MKNYEDEFMNVLLAKRLCYQTKQEYLWHLRKYMGFCYHEGIPAEDMPHNGLLKFMGEAKSESSAKQRRAIIITLYGSVLDQGFKLKGLPIPIQRVKVPESLSPEEIQRIFNAVPQTKEGKKQLLILKMMYACGLRVSEAVSVHINQIRQKFNVRAGRNYYELKITGKGTKERLIPIPDETANEMFSHIKERQITGYLFKGQFRECYSAKSVQDVFTRAKIAARINTPGNTHLLRKSRTTRFVDAQMNDRTVMQFFGWSNQKTMNHYHHSSTASMKNAIDEIDKSEAQFILLNSHSNQQLLKQA